MGFKPAMLRLLKWKVWRIESGLKTLLKAKSVKPIFGHLGLMTSVLNIWSFLLSFHQMKKGMLFESRKAFLTI